MSYVLKVQLPPETQEPLEAEARRIGLAPADFIAGIMAQRYGVARNVPTLPLLKENDDLSAEEIHEMLHGPTVTLSASTARADAKIRAHAPEVDWNAWDNLSGAEKDAEVERSIAALPENVRAQMEREGLI